MEIQLNGKPHRAPEGISLAALLEQLGLGEQRVAVEHNGEIVPRGRHATIPLAPGDRIEIVHAIGGG